ncbi:acetyltransferase [Bosea sp. F3-2]|uniref:acetyltransferase n=1 Tax=Bosea sp. F3-2 TaxID=2599640 RepID=UPI0020BD748D|nr:acetyltransferase [Bosea sp. F3-2]
MKDIVIFGVGNIAELAAFYLTRDAGRRVAGFTVDAAYLSEPSWNGYPVVAWEEVEQRFPPGSTDVFVAVSYTKLNKFRRDKVAEARAKGYGIASYVSSRATIFEDFVAQPNQFILEDNTIQPFARIGENVTLWSGNHIGHHSAIAEDTFIASHVVVSGGVTIGPRCFIGVNVTIRDHVTIGADCVIGAGSLVLSDIPDNSVLSPASTEISKVPSHRLRRI